MFEILKQDPNSRARLGVITTPHGLVETPAYVIVGTHGAVRCLTGDDLPSTKTQLIIANTYHLWRTLTDEGLQDFPGLHAYMGWNGPVMTDSGGFQVFSLGFLRDNNMRRGQAPDGAHQTTDAGKWVRVTPAGVYFRETDAGGEEYLDAELSVRIQEQLGADIIAAFDEPVSPTATHEYAEESMERTHAWARRSLEAKNSAQFMYGVVQGGLFEDLRRESARVIGAMEFDGIAIGSTYGDAYGGTRAKTREAVRWSVDNLPGNRPRHLFGVGRIEDLLEGVAEGIDTFDCVVPTREARHGRLWTSQGHVDIAKSMHWSDDSPIETGCECPVCLDPEFSRGRLHSFFKDKNPEAGRLATVHNVFFFNDLMEKVRRAIQNEKFAEFKKEYLSRLQ